MPKPLGFSASTFSAANMSLWLSVITGLLGFMVGRRADLNFLTPCAQRAAQAQTQEYPFATAADIQELALFQQDSNKTRYVSAPGPESFMWPSTFHQLFANRECDKRTHVAYKHMYDKYIAPMKNHHVRLLEIGIGCVNNVSYAGHKGNPNGYTPGRSVKVWEDALPNGQLHFVEYDVECAAGIRTLLEGNGHKLYVGDQAQASVLANVIAEAGERSMDIVIDDGGHTFPQQVRSILALFPRLVRPGGIYVIEDLENSVDRTTGRPKQGSTLEWIQQLMALLTIAGSTVGRLSDLTPPRQILDSEIARLGLNWSLIGSIRSIDCFEDACVFVKKDVKDR